MAQGVLGVHAGCMGWCRGCHGMHTGGHGGCMGRMQGARGWHRGCLGWHGGARDAHGVARGCTGCTQGATGSAWGGTGGVMGCAWCGTGDAWGDIGRAMGCTWGGTGVPRLAHPLVVPRWSRVPRSGEVTAARPKERDLLAGVKPPAQDLKLSKADQPRTGAAVGLGAGPRGCPTPCPPAGELGAMGTRAGAVHPGELPKGCWWGGCSHLGVQRGADP